MSTREIVDAVAYALPIADAATETVTVGVRSKIRYLPGIPTMHETTAVPEMLAVVQREQLLGVDAMGFEVPFVNLPLGAKRFPMCDAVLHFGSGIHRQSWAVQFKRIQFLGDNGKNNDYGFQKLLSPYLKDRSLLHDCESLRRSGLGDRQFVIGYSFRHSLPLLTTALERHPQHTDRIKNAIEVCQREISGELNPEVGVSMVNNFLQSEGLVFDHATAKFSGAWRHPCGGDGLIFGWELKPEPLQARRLD